MGKFLSDKDILRATELSGMAVIHNEHGKGNLCLVFQTQFNPEDGILRASLSVWCSECKIDEHFKLEEYNKAVERYNELVKQYSY
jgi:hypothetical protein